MRDILNKSLEVLVWISAAFFIIASCYIGALIFRGAPGAPGDMIGGFMFIVFGVTFSFVFAGICFQIMDIRMFLKHTALALKRGGN